MAKLPATQDQTKKLRPVSKKTRTAIEALLTGRARTQGEAAEIAGMDRTSLVRALKKPNATATINDMIRERVGTYGFLMASATAERLMQHAESEYVQADIAKTILAVNGVKPTQDRAQSAGQGISLTIVMRSPDDTKTIEHDAFAITPTHGDGVSD